MAGSHVRCHVYTDCIVYVIGCSLQNEGFVRRKFQLEKKQIENFSTICLTGRPLIIENITFRLIDENSFPVFLHSFISDHFPSHCSQCLQ